jgi:hypothetical protein
MKAVAKTGEACRTHMRVIVRVWWCVYKQIKRHRVIDELISVSHACTSTRCVQLLTRVRGRQQETSARQARACQLG